MRRGPAILLLLLFGAIRLLPADDPLAGRGNGEAAAQDILAINDQVAISARDVPGVSDTPFRIDADGTITLPLVGKVRAEGLTVEQFRKELVDQLKIYLRSPEVSVRLLTETTDTIVVAGSFKAPGVHELPVRRTLLDVISAVGGLQPAASAIYITRQARTGALPLPSASEDPVSKASTATVSLKRLFGNPGAHENLIVEPGDLLTAESAGVVFLTGEVLNPGAFPLDERDSIGVAELISLAGGFSRSAAPEDGRVLRQILNGSKRAEIPVNIASILNGDSFDFPVQRNDIVVVPRPGGKAAAVKSALRYVIPGLVTTLLYITLRN